jgi:dethiobiotin synthetase
MRGCFVTGTDTGVGKTVLAATIVATLRARGEHVRALKPVITGLDEPPDPVWPPDDELLASVADTTPAAVAPLRYGAAASPHLAAEMAGEPLSADALRAVIARARAESAAGGALIVEGVGGLLVPLCTGYDVRELIRDASLPVVICARPGLGTINHTLLTVEAARAAALEVRAVVLNPWPEDPGPVARSNRATIGALGRIPVWTLPPLPGPDPSLMARAGAALPLDAWLEAIQPVR